VDFLNDDAASVKKKNPIGSRPPAGFIGGPHFHDPHSSGVFYTTKVFKKQAAKRSRANPAKLERCVKKVKKRKGVRSAYAVCKASISSKTKRKRNPRQDWYVHIQRANGPVMMFNGRGFANTTKPQPFSSANAAMYKARWLLGHYHRQLSKYRIWVSDQYYGGPTVNTRVNPRRKNPQRLDAAARKLEDFTGRKATHVERAPARSSEKTGLVIGEMNEVSYLAAREGIDGGRTAEYHHKFRKGSRPLLAVSTDGKQLHVVGGQYEFTDAGIEDR
jgi:hypothetical protein